METSKIWSTFESALRAFFYSRLDDKSLVDDFVQELFLKVHLKSKMLRDPKKFRSWVFSIARNQINDYHRSKKQMYNLDTNKLPDLVDNQIEAAINIDCCLEKFLASISEDQRKVLLATIVGGQSQKAFAKEFKIAYPTVKARLQRGKRKLKSIIQETCGIETDGYGNILNYEDMRCAC